MVGTTNCDWWQGSVFLQKIQWEIHDVDRQIDSFRDTNQILIREADAGGKVEVRVCQNGIWTSPVWLLEPEKLALPLLLSAVQSCVITLSWLLFLFILHIYQSCYMNAD